jgi:site-specific DNA-methyltransferase (adenine-specific)
MEVHKNHNHTIIHGNAIEVLSDYIQDSSVDLIFADPPYNIGKNFNGRKDKWPDQNEYLKWSYQWISACIRKLKPGGSFYLMASTQSMPYFDIYLSKKMDVLSRIIWSYDSSGVQAKKYFGSLYEPILFCVKDKKNYTFNSENILVEAKTGAKRKLIDYRGDKPKPYNSKKVPGNVWYFPRVRYRMEEYEKHPTQKPVTLLERIIKASSAPGDVILDPFSGTFTTSCVAKEHGRSSIGIEIEEEYVKIGLRRLEFQTLYKGEKLKREPKTYERKNYSPEQILLFAERRKVYGTSVH